MIDNTPENCLMIHRARTRLCFKTLLANPGATRTELCTLLGIRSSAVQDMVAALIDAGFARQESQPGRSKGGAWQLYPVKPLSELVTYGDLNITDIRQDTRRQNKGFSQTSGRIIKPKATPKKSVPVSINKNLRRADKSRASTILALDVQKFLESGGKVEKGPGPGGVHTASPVGWMRSDTGMRGEF